MAHPESASNEAATTSKRHYFVALLVSLALSVMLWILFGQFDAVGFVFWTSTAALLGSSVGLVMDRNIWVTVGATAAIRLIIFAIVWFVM